MWLCICACKLWRAIRKGNKCFYFKIYQKLIIYLPILFSREKASTRFKLAALLLRRKAINEKTVYDDIVLYNPAEYEVLLRHWPAEPYLNHLAAFSGPLVMGNEPELTLVMQCFQWSRQLALNAGYPNEKGIRG